MHRPITPRDMDEDGLSRSHSNSTTPRATSPITPHTHYISQSHSDRLPPVPASPTGSPSSLNRNNSGRQPVLLPSPFSSTSSRVHSPSSSEDRTVHASSNGNKSSPTSILLDRRRPASPLAGLTFQPLVSSRSPTPASTWSPQYSSQSRGPEYYSPTTASHDRHESVTTASTHEMDLYHNITRSKSAARSLSSPALPESPFIDGDPAMTSRNWPRPDSNISGIDMNSSPSRGPVRSPTPGARSPTPARSNTPNPRPVTPARSPTPKFQPNADSSATNGLYGYDGRTTGTTMNGNGGSKYLHSPSSSSSSAGVPPLAFSPLLNSSTSSLVSVSSSYHSWDEGATGKKGMFSFLFAPPFFEDPEQVRAVETVDPEPTYVPDRMHEDILHRFVGLTKDDFVAIHAKLVAAGSARRNTQPDLNKNGSKRRRRPSASQSVSHIVTQDQIPTDTEVRRGPAFCYLMLSISFYRMKCGLFPSPHPWLRLPPCSHWSEHHWNAPLRSRLTTRRKPTRCFNRSWTVYTPPLYPRHRRLLSCQKLLLRLSGEKIAMTSR
jgi:serine/arginine repetitive matrix protein 2